MDFLQINNEPKHANFTDRWGGDIHFYKRDRGPGRCGILFPHF